MRDSNPRPAACKAAALPTELTALILSFLGSHEQGYESNLKPLIEPLASK